MHISTVNILQTVTDKTNITITSTESVMWTFNFEYLFQFRIFTVDFGIFSISKNLYANSGHGGCLKNCVLYFWPKFRKIQGEEVTKSCSITGFLLIMLIAHVGNSHLNVHIQGQHWFKI